MREALLALAFLLVGPLAVAAGSSWVDLDKPGVMNQLKVQHPQRYQAISAVLQASSRPACLGNELKLLEAQFRVQDVECGMMLLTRYPALRKVTFELDGTSYRATVSLEEAATPQPASATNAHLLDSQ